MEIMTMEYWKGKLPQDIESKILSYLYFSDQKSKKIKKVNKNIKNYNIIQLAYLNDKHDLLIICYFTLKYFLYDKNKSEKLFLDYTMLSKEPEFQKNELMRIFTNLRIIDVMRMCKYIESDGDSSDFYSD